LKAHKAFYVRPCVPSHVGRISGRFCIETAAAGVIAEGPWAGSAVANGKRTDSFKERRTGAKDGERGRTIGVGPEGLV
jgi:hypothetical protein